MSVAISTNHTFEPDDGFGQSRLERDARFNRGDSFEQGEGFDQGDRFQQGDTLEQVVTPEQLRAYHEMDSVDPAADPAASTVQELFSQAKLNDTLTMVVRLARQALPCDGAGVMLADDAGLMSPAAASDRTAAQADALQVSTRQGPGYQVVRRQQPVIASDLRTDSRWRFWAPKAADLGFRSVLTLALDDGDTSGALTFYSRRVSAFNTPDLASSRTFAQQASIAIAVARERQQLLAALSSRTDVGRAEGILMERYGVTAAQARTVLQRYATHLDVPLPEVAEDVVRDRSLPKVAFAIS